MKKPAIAFIAMIFAFTAWTGVHAKPDGGRIQLAILLDTSNSMDGLINQAKAQLWKMVNEIATARRDGMAPVLEVALFEYGNDRIPASEGHIRMITPFTRDLDRVSEDLFRLTTCGGSEYCGGVIENAVSNLQWSKDPSDLKLVFIAGNEPFNQGTTDYREAAHRAYKKGIVVNTIYCGGYQDGVNGLWKDGAELAHGKYINIDHNAQAEQIVAPQDPEIMSLNQQLNDTYVAYGQEGKKKQERQAAQDKKAKDMGAASEVDRSLSKSSGLYSNAEWDVVDYAKENKGDISRMDESKMPGNMRKMNKKEREVYVKNLSAKRAKIQDRLKVLGNERQKYIAAERQKKGQKNTLENAMMKTFRDQAEAMEYKFK